jgi:tetratricopeptide (TPR) repeat protein
LSQIFRNGQGPSFTSPAFRHALISLTLLAAVLITASQVPAAQQAEADVLVARAVLAYDDQRYDDALDLLRRAINLDPQNARALYYSGLTYLAMKQPEQAVGPLERARKLRPNDENVQLQLGIAYFTAGNYDQAAPLLEQYYAAHPESENLGYYVGVGRYRQKKYKEAVSALESAKVSDPDLAQLTKFYRGLALGVLGLSQEASTELQAVQGLQNIDPFSQAAAQIGVRLASMRAAEESKRFRGQYSVGVYYDDNVAINPNPSNDPVAESFRSRRTNSPGFMTSLLADYSFYRKGPMEGTITYSFYQTLNMDDALQRFNIQDHQLLLSGFYRGTVRNVPYQFAAQYTYDYLFLDEAGFLSRSSPVFSLSAVPPSFRVPGIGSVGNLTTALYRYQRKEFYREPGNNDPRFGSEVRDAFNNMIGLVHVFRFANDKYLIRFGYQYDNEAAEGASFTYTGNRLQLGWRATLPWWNLMLRYDYDFHWRAYSNPQTLFVNDQGIRSQRYDKEQIHLLQLIKPLTQSIILTLQYQRIRNDSNIPVYDYTKNVATAFVTFQF